MDIHTFDNYLKDLPIPVEDKRYLSAFFRKREHFDSITHYVSQNFCGRIHYGYGNCNSKIFIVMQEYGMLKTMLKFVPPCLEHIHISIQNTWITFYDKGAGKNFNSKIYSSELKTLCPEIIIYITRKGNTYSDGQKLYILYDDIEHVLDLKSKNLKDERYTETMKIIYAFLPVMIPFKEIEYPED